MRCPACAADLPDGARFCLACGAATETHSLSRAATSVGPPSSTSGEGRFPGGTILAGRYRIVSLAGRGGMGEVYRAWDTRLDQEVALKFLPEKLAADGAALARFHNEVRTARQVSHPNVCRVHDIGVAEGLHYLSMEFVDGEDLQSVLRRFGRLPEEKATEIARKLCAGLAAAHDRGVLHRDLKPANVMINSRGQVLITDFGLAAVSDRIGDDEIRHGTPAYMSPEQLTGKEVTARSDIYSLGLLLYEIYTGKRAFEARTLEELMRLHATATPASPSSLVKELDPAVERVILRCLDRDPTKRPASALAIAAALPGGDPLAAALAAGETPSPELVAASGESAGISVRAAVAWLVVAILSAVLLVTIGADRAYVHQAAPPLQPAVLAQRARDIAASLGYARAPAYTAWGFVADEKLHDWTLRNGRRPDASGLVQFWYREWSKPLVTDGLTGDFRITDRNPEPLYPGMKLVRLDILGRLIEFRSIPEPEDKPVATTPPTDWKPLLDAAGLKLESLNAAGADFVPPSLSDTRGAWTGTHPVRNVPVRVEAASWSGRPVYFRIFWPWAQSAERPTVSANVQINELVMLPLTLVAGAWLARRNLRLGRGDRRGAWRLAAIAFVLRMLVWVLGATHAADVQEIHAFFGAVGRALIQGGRLWILYIALEPYVRRRWPQSLIGWSRLLAGGFRDPLFGRDLLVGSAVGLGLTVFGVLIADVMNIPRITNPIYGLSDDRRLIGVIFESMLICFDRAFTFFLLLFLLHVLLRRLWLAAAVATVLMTALVVGIAGVPAIGPMFLAIFGSAAWVTIRFGVTANLLREFGTWTFAVLPITSALGAWYAASTWLVMGLILAMACYGFNTALGGRKLIGDDLLKD